MSNIMQDLKPIKESSDESCGFFKMTKIETNGSTNNETDYRTAAAALASSTNEESKKLDEKSNFGDSAISEIAGVVSSNDTANFTALAKLDSFGSSVEAAGSRNLPAGEKNAAQMKTQVENPEEEEKKLSVKEQFKLRLAAYRKKQSKTMNFADQMELRNP